MVVHLHNRKPISSKKELLIHTTVFLNLKSIMLSEISQSQKGTYSVIPLMLHSLRGKIWGNKNQGWGSGS